MTDNKNENKRIAQNTIYLYIQSVCMLIVGLYTSRVSLQALGVTDYGIYNAVAGVISTFSLLTGNMTTASQRFITYALGKSDSQNTKAVFNTCITIHLIIGVLVVFLMEIVGVWFLNHKMSIPEDRLWTANIVFQITVINAFINLICVPYDAIIIAYEKMKAFAYIGVYEGIMKLILVASLLYFNYDKLILYAFFLLLVMLSKRVLYILYTKRNFIEAKEVRYKLDKSISKEFTGFVGWNMIGSSAAVLRNSGMDVLLNVFFGVVVNAAKGICNQVQSAVMQFINVFQTAINPQLVKSVAENDFARNHNLLIHGTKITFYMLLVLSVPLFVCAEELLALWLVEVPVYALIFIKLTIASLWIESISTYLSINIMATGNIRNYQLVVGGIKLLVLPLSYVFIKYCEAKPTIGLTINIFLDSLCFAIRLYFNYKRVHLSTFDFVRSVCLKCILVFILSILTSFIFRRFISSSLLVLLPSSALLTLIIIWCIGLSAIEKEKVKGLLLNKLVGIKND